MIYFIFGWKNFFVNFTYSLIKYTNLILNVENQKLSLLPQKFSLKASQKCLQGTKVLNTLDISEDQSFLTVELLALVITFETKLPG